jgi:hypothetical protein
MNTENLTKKLGKSNEINEPKNRKRVVTVDSIARALLGVVLLIAGSIYKLRKKTDKVGSGAF